MERGRSPRGRWTQAPANFDRTVPVPGLVSLATPAFDAPGPKVANRQSVPQKDPKRDAFWYRRTFTLDGPVPAVAKLKVAKAMFGTRVFLNGTLLGDHLPSFTPGYFDAKPALKTGSNEILIRVGADRDAVGRAYPDGFDFEKERYIPGIFDSVELILSGTPHFMTRAGGARRCRQDGARAGRVAQRRRGGKGRREVRRPRGEVRQGRRAGRRASRSIWRRARRRRWTSASRSTDCRLWSPEDPFLYTLEADSGADSFRTRFGMREFKFDPATGRAMLNGKPYFMRGSNITLYRFFEDSECGKLPWDEKWVRLLHQRVKDMHWNCLRYCIGFPPEAWYDIADEEGILIQDEFPIWFGGDVPQGTADATNWPTEYAEWMRERWNHPCVAIWDASNETLSPKTGAAIQAGARRWISRIVPGTTATAAPQEPGDMFEVAPVSFLQCEFQAGATLPPPIRSAGNAGNDGKHAVVINEYGWHWLNRDGTPTTLTQRALPEPARARTPRRRSGSTCRPPSWPPTRNSGARIARPPP